MALTQTCRIGLGAVRSGPGASAHLLTTMFQPFVRGEGATDEATCLP